MKLRSLAFLFCFAFLGAAGSAHGDFKHVIGTVEKISADSVTVKTANGSSVEVKLVATTTFVMRSGGVDKPAKLADLAVGDRVVIHAKPKGGALEAAEVRFSAPAEAPATNKPKF
ncbi:MAG TPA: DUF5666 domain-containing protein [Candidatus Solibacter sp.]|nr:DUF5666 domain-containing protein [Candidatus Solibacter sp.]